MPRQSLRFALLCLCVCVLSSCGGGGSSSGGGGTGNTPDFVLLISPTTITSPQDSTTTAQAEVSASNGFAGQVSVTISGLPAGVSVAPTTIYATATVPAALTFTISASTPVATTPITFQGTSGTLTHTATAHLQVTAASSGSGASPTRTKTLRSGNTPTAGVFDSAHGNYFVAVQSLNKVEVISAASQTITNEIPVPNPTSLALTPDGTQILVGTMTQSLYWISTTSFEVVRQDTLPTVLPIGFGTAQFITPILAMPTANGSVLMACLADDSGAYLIEYDPTTRATRFRNEEGVGGFGSVPTEMSVSADGSIVLFGEGSTPAVYNAKTDNFVVSTIGGVYLPALNSAGTEVALAGGDTVYFYDTNFTPLGQTALNIQQRPTGAVFSSDGKYLYVVTPGTTPLISTIDATTFALVNQAPAFIEFYPYFSGSTVETPLAADATGLVLGWFDHGIVFDDAKNGHDTQNGITNQGVIVATPAEGPVAGSTNVVIATQSFTSAPDVYFGANHALAESLTNLNQVQATTPPAQAVGPVDVKTLQGSQVSIIAQGFSYGVTAVPYGLLAAPPTGGEVSDVIGFGFGADVQDPSLAVSIDSTKAQVTKSQIVQTEIPFPIAIQDATFTIPAGTTGLHDINVSSSVGQGKVSKGFRYITGVSDFTSTDAFTGILFDKSRDQLYLLAGDHVDVFSVASNAFVSPIAIPSLGGKKSVSGFALTPDSSTLLVSNSADSSVAIIPIDNPSSASAVAMPSANGATLTPSHIAATSLGTAFVDVGSNMDTTGSRGGVWQLTLGAKKFTYTGDPGPTSGADFLASSADGTLVYVTAAHDSGGWSFVWNAATNVWTTQELQQYLADAVVSADGNSLATIPVDPGSGAGLPPLLLDPSDSLRCQVGTVDPMFDGAGSGIRLDDSGGLLFVPSSAGIDVFDFHHCDLRERIFLKEQVNTQAVPASAIDATAEHLFFVTTNGLTVVSLDAAPLSIGSVTPASGAAGTQVTIRGTGFVQGTTASLNGTSASVTLVDASTAQLTIPAALSAGAVSIKLTNPDGTTYTLDNAFTIN